MAPAADKDEGLKRLGGGRWQTRDERFTIEPQSGTWAIVDAEQTDDLGLPLVRGPYKSLTAAKEAIAEARDSAAPTSSIKGRPSSSPAPAPAKASKGPKAAKAEAPEEPEEPRWMRDLEAADRRRATRLIELLTKAGASDAEGMVRRDLVGDVPAVAGFAVEQALRSLGADASAAEVADLLADGRDTALGVRWRLVDGDGRPISLDPDALS
ncbi:MAG TPA: hypothetical protein VHK05_01760 [Candidatus Limnocylindrales bacterium]|jgi:hypothetical protein|nr:hypothetical protein [Candidatus Limnocylindrales bacterium]